MLAVRTLRLLRRVYGGLVATVALFVYRLSSVDWYDRMGDVLQVFDLLEGLGRLLLCVLELLSAL
jgi:hypothetical protein